MRISDWSSDVCSSDLMCLDVIEEFLRSVVHAVVERCPDELAILERDTEKLKNIGKPFPRITYSDAVKIIRGEKDVNGRNSILTQIGRASCRERVCQYV